MEYNLRRIRSKMRSDVKAVETILKECKYEDYISDDNFYNLFESVVFKTCQECLYKFTGLYKENASEYMTTFVEDMYEKISKYNDHNFKGWIKRSFENAVNDYNKMGFNQKENPTDFDAEENYYLTSNLSCLDEYPSFTAYFTDYQIQKAYFEIFVDSLKSDKKYTKEQKQEIIKANGRGENTLVAISKKYGFTLSQIKHERLKLEEELCQFYEDNGFKTNRKS